MRRDWIMRESKPRWNRGICAWLALLGVLALGLIITPMAWATEPPPGSSLNVTPDGTTYRGIGTSVTYTATCSCSTPHNIQWTGTAPSLTVGGGCGASTSTLSGTCTVAGSYTIAASCAGSNPPYNPAFNHGSDDELLKVIEVTGLSVSGATVGISQGSTNYYTAIAGSGDVTITATINPSVPVGELPAGFVSWSGGTAGASQLERKVSKTTAGSTGVTCTIGTSQKTVTIKVVEVTDLSVSGATVGVSQNSTNYYAAIAATGDVTVTATVNPSVSTGDLPGGIVSWSGGTTGDNLLQRKVSKTTAGSTGVSCTVGTSSKTVTVKVVEVTGLGVSGATVGVSQNSTNYYAAIAATGDVVLTATLNPSVSIDDLPGGIVSWSGGTTGDNLLERKVSKTAAGSTDVTCTVGTSQKTVAIKVAEVTDLSISGATEGTPADTYYAAIEDTGDVVLTATLNPSVSVDDLPGGIVSWSAGTAGANQLERKVSKTTASSTEVTCTVGTSSKSATIKVVEVTGLSVSGATEGTPAGTYYAAIAATGDVILTATLNPSVSAADLPDGIVSWTNGTAGANKLQRTVTKTVVGSTMVIATCGDSTATAVTMVVEVTVLSASGATEGTPAGTYYAAIAATGDVVLTATLNPAVSAGNLPDGIVSWTGGATGATKLERKVTKTVADSTTVTATCGTSSASATVKVVEITALSVSGATEGTPEDTYYAAIADTGDVILTVTLNPSVSAGDLPNGIVSWTNGTAGANKLERKVTKTIADSTVVTATCGTSTESATVKVVEVTDLDVSGATEGTPAGTYYVAKADTGDVVITAILNPSVSATDLPDGIVSWTGGVAGANKLERKVTKTVAASTDVTCTVGTSEEEVTIHVVSLDFDAAGVADADEESVGAFVGVNDDDDDEDTVTDNVDTNGVVGENDFSSLSLSLLPAGLPATDVLEVSWTNGTKVNVFANNDRTDGITSGQTYAPAALPQTLYLEGNASSSSVRDVELSLKYKNGGTTLFEDKLKATVVAVDLDLAGVNDGDERTAGAIIKFNDDDDDADGVTDKDDTEVIGGDNDFIALTLQDPLPLDLPHTDKVKLMWSGNDLKLYETQTKKSQGQSSEINSGKEYSLADLPKTVYAEGVEGGTEEVTLEYVHVYNGETVVHKDIVKINVFRVDLDIDSDNNNGYNAPARSTAEEGIENVTGDGTKPGKTVAVNENDNDSDDIPDFADGFNWDGTDANADDSNTSEHFVPLVLEVMAPINLTTAKVKITYDASDPAGVTHNGTPPVYAPASGKLRIWKKAGNQARNKNSAQAAQNPGDYVPSDTFTAAQLGLCGETRIVTLYVEDIGGSTTVADLQIKAEVDPDGDGPMGFHVEDAVRLTSVTIESVHPVSGDFATGKAGRIMISTSKDSNFYTTTNTTANDGVAQTTDRQVTISAYVTPKVEGAHVYFEVIDPDDQSPYERDAYVTSGFTQDGDADDDVLDVTDTSAYTADPTNGTGIVIYVKTSTTATPVSRTRTVKAKTSSTITVADLDIDVPTNSLVKLTTPEAQPNDNRDSSRTMAGGAISNYNSFQGCLSASSAATQLKTINGTERAVAEVTLTVTDRYAGDNYLVRATCLDPQDEPFNNNSGVSPNSVDVNTPDSRIAETVTLVAWKRVYLEYDQMYQQGATLTADFTSDGDANDDTLTVDNTNDFTADPTSGTEVVIFTAAGASVERRVKTKTSTTITVDDLPSNLPQYSGVKVKANNNVFGAGTGRVDDAYGSITDGSDGGAFVEFPIVPTGSRNIPHYYSFPNTSEIRYFCSHWFSNVSSSNNVIQLVSADKDANGYLGAAWYAYNISWIGIGNHTASYDSEVSVAHELGHQFQVSNSHVDQQGSSSSRVVNHAGADFCIMSYDSYDLDNSVEFDIDCLFDVRDVSDPL